MLWLGPHYGGDVKVDLSLEEKLFHMRGSRIKCSEVGSGWHDESAFSLVSFFRVTFASFLLLLGHEKILKMNSQAIIIITF